MSDLLAPDGLTLPEPHPLLPALLARWIVEANADDDDRAAGLRYAAILHMLVEHADDELTRDDRAAGAIDRELRAHLTTLREAMTSLAADEAPRWIDGRLELDELFAQHLDRMPGQHAHALAVRVREASGARGEAHRHQTLPAKGLFRLWMPLDGSPAARFVVALAEVVWLDTIRPKLEREWKKPPALVMAVYHPLHHLLSRTTRLEERDGQKWLRFANQAGHAVMRTEQPAAIGADAINHLMVDRGLKLFGSVTAHRLLRWQIFAGHRQALEGHPDPRVLTVEGGWATLAHDILGMKGRKAAAEVSDIVEAEDVCQLPLPPDGAYSRLLIRHYTPPRGQRSGHIKLILGFHLLPDYVQQLRDTMGTTLEARRALRLVPVLELPPFTGREREHGAQASLSMAIVSYMRDHARDLVEEGGVSLDPTTLLALAQQVGLPPALLDAVLDRWTQDGDDGPAFLKFVARERYTLSDAYSAARAFLEQGGKSELDGSEAGRRGAKSKQNKIHRLAQRSKK